LSLFTHAFMRRSETVNDFPLEFIFKNSASKISIFGFSVFEYRVKFENPSVVQLFLEDAKQENSLFVTMSKQFYCKFNLLMEDLLFRVPKFCSWLTASSSKNFLFCFQKISLVSFNHQYVTNYEYPSFLDFSSEKFFSKMTLRIYHKSWGMLGIKSSNNFLRIAQFILGKKKPLLLLLLLILTAKTSLKKQKLKRKNCFFLFHKTVIVKMQLKNLTRLTWEVWYYPLKLRSFLQTNAIDISLMYIPLERNHE